MSVKKILISVDVEEFDIPEEYGQKVPPAEKLRVSYQGVLKTLVLLNEMDVRATFFITAYWAEHFPVLVKEIAQRHEIASHTYYHNQFVESDLLRSREALERISNTSVTGFRMPRLQPVNSNALERAGYTYDASLSPTWLPGRYNNLHRRREVHREGKLWIMPTSVTPAFRIPVFWLSVKNMPLWFSKHCSRRILEKDDYLSFYFHPWELEDIGHYKLPFVVKKVRGKQLYEKLRRYLLWLKGKGQFVSHSDYLASVTSGGEA